MTMLDDRRKAGRIRPEALARGVVLWVGAAVLGYLVITALANNGGPGEGAVPLDRPAPLAGVLGVALLVILLRCAAGLLTRDPSKARRRLDLGCGLVCACCFGLALWWGAQSDFIPEGTDMAWVRQASLDLLSGQYDGLLNEYLIRHPYQIGTALYFEGVFRLFGTTATWPVSLTNALWWAVSVWCGYRLTGCMAGAALLPQAVYLMLAAVCLPPLLYSPLFYGDVVAIGCSFLAVWLFVRLHQTQKPRYLAGVCMVLLAGTLVRNTVLLTALAILLVQCFAPVCAQGPAPAWGRAKALCTAALLAAVFAACLHSDAFLNRYMRFRTGFSLGPGLPKSTFLVMGSKESQRGCGWYDGWQDWVAEAANGDMELADLKSRIELRRRYEAFADDPAYAVRFFHKKLESEWADPTFQSLSPYYYAGTFATTVEGTPFAVSLYSGGLRRIAAGWMDLHQSLVYLGAFCWAAALLRPRCRALKLWQLTPVVVFLGGFFFYAVWEAQGRYCLPFFLMLLPAAACGAPVLRQALRAVFARAAGAAGRLLGRKAPAKDPDAPAREN